MDMENYLRRSFLDDNPTTADVVDTVDAKSSSQLRLQLLTTRN